MKSLIIIASFIFCTITFAQPLDIPHHVKRLNITLTDFKKDFLKSSVNSEVYSIKIGESGAPFLRVYFKNTELGRYSYLKMTSLQDGISQTLNASKLKKWKNTSIFFNGDQILVELYKNKYDKNINVSLDNLFVGELINNQTIDGVESICGSEDNRISSDHKAVGRIVPVGCTAWISPSGKLVSAGHCATNFDDEIIEFNVPQSLSDGTIQHPEEEDQYLVDTFEYEYNSSSDWLVLNADTNAETGLTPKEAQGTFFYLERTNQFEQDEDFRITGFGVDGPSPDFGAGSSDKNEYSQTQQTDLGKYHSLTGTKLRYVVDTQPANSGSPIIREDNGKVLGVHTTGGCGSEGYNEGTSLLNENFWNKVRVTGVDQVLNDGTTSIGTIGRWNGNSFAPRFIPPKFFKFTTNSYEVLHGEKEIISNQKYNNWNKDYTNIKNHHVFPIQVGTTELTSNFALTYAGITIKNDLESYGINGGNIEFKDPWLIDYADPIYGNNKRNQGMSAPFKTRSSPFCPDYSTIYNNDVYRGIFFNQSGHAQNWNPPYYSVKSAETQDIYLSETGKTHKFYFQGWSAEPEGSAEFRYPDDIETPVVFKAENAVVKANLKGTQLSNDPDAFTNSSQRKFVRSNNGNLHYVYESMGRVWYETSSDNGATWTIANSGKSVSALDSKNPSIDNYGDVVGIAYQEKYGDSYKIRFAYFYSNGNKFGDYVVDDQSDFIIPDSYTSDANPVVARGPSGQLMIVWQRANEGLFYRYGAVNYFYWGVEWITGTLQVPGSDLNSQNPTIAGFKSGSTPVFHLAWDQSRSQIQYYKLTISGGAVNFSNGSIYGNGIGFYEVYKPDISVNPLNSGDYRIVFIGKQQSYGDYKASTYHASHNTYYKFGSWIKTASINAVSDDASSIIAWTNSSNSVQFAVLNNIYMFTEDMNNSGIVQLNNGTTRNTTYGMAFSTSSMPYAFNLSLPLGSLPKRNVRQISSGREIVTSKDSVDYFCILGDISVDDNSVDFIDYKPDQKIKSMSDINKHLVSKPFALKNDSEIKFNLQYGVTDSALSIISLKDNDYLKYRLELVDDNSDEVLEILDEVIFSKNKTVSVQGESYSIKSGFAENKTVKLRLASETNIESESKLCNIYADNAALMKEGENNVKKITLQGLTQVKNYSLAQNHPNPFNPSTTITFALPQKGEVVLKIYNSLGQEVKTLVNKFKEEGIHKATFDASNLPSGVYIYSIQANDFMQSKKMILLK